MKPHRGLSEIVASMVVLIIVSVLGVMLYNISLQGMNSQQNSMLSDVGVSEKVAQEKFEIVDVKRVNPSHVKITFYNYGPIEINVTDVYLNIGGDLRHLSIGPDNWSDYLSLHKGILQSGVLTDITIVVSYYPDLITYVITSESGVSNEYTLSQPI